MTILHSPDGQPVWCPPGRVGDLLTQGYRVQVDDRPLSPAIAETVALSGGTNLNDASLKELIALPGIGTATAKKIQQSRPYGSLEDLIERVPEVAWMSLRGQVNVDQSTDQEDQDAVGA